MSNILLIILIFTLCKGSDDIESLTDLRKCKLTHLGLEYTGDIKRTESGISCQSWTQSPSNFTNEMFPDYTIVKANDNCRNPNKNPEGLWCYTTNPEVLDEVCDIPICKFPSCRKTGPGIEYAGTDSTGISSRKCLTWNHRYHQVKNGSSTYTSTIFNKKLFPDLSAKKAKNYCRNPNNDIGGPWCYVRESDFTKKIEMEYCDVKFCDEPLSMAYVNDNSKYTHFTRFNNTDQSLNFGLTLWSSDDFRNASVYILLSALPIPVYPMDVTRLGIGIEIFISNNKTGLTQNNREDIVWVNSSGLISSKQYSNFSLEWHSTFITLTNMDSSRDISIWSYNAKRNLISLEPEKFFFYSVRGKVTI